MDLSERVLETKEIYAGRVVHLRVDTIQLPDGQESKREIVVHRGAVCIVAITDRQEVLMVRQFRLAAGKALLEIPAGTLEEGEDPLECAKRELLEETGYSAKELRPLFAAYLAPGYSTELIHSYLATGLFKPEKLLSMDADENIALETIPIVGLESMILKGELHDSKSISSILMALRIIARGEG